MNDRVSTALTVAWISLGGMSCGNAEPVRTASLPMTSGGVPSAEASEKAPPPKSQEEKAQAPQAPGAAPVSHPVPASQPSSPTRTGGATAPVKEESGAPSTRSSLAAPLPKPLIKTHFNKGAGKYVFRDRAWDLAQIKKAFNGVIVSYDDPQLVSDLRAAGLAAFVEFDAKDDMATGQRAQKAVAAIIRQVKLNPGTIAGIRVADRLNEKLSLERAVEYLRVTGGVFHREIPGVPVVVDVEDWELTCGLPGQSSCLTHKFTSYSNCIDAVLIELHKTGYVDGFELAVNLKQNDAGVMEKAIEKARRMFPPPFLIYARTASLSFEEDAYPGDASMARKQVAAFIDAPLRAGADGIDLWAWHRPFKSELRTFLNKDSLGNPLWEEMIRAYSQASSPGR